MEFARDNSSLIWYPNKFLNPIIVTNIQVYALD